MDLKDSEKAIDLLTERTSILSFLKHENSFRLIVRLGINDFEASERQRHCFIGAMKILLENVEKELEAL